jgi:hypothetical protein
MTKKEQRTANKALSQWGLTSFYETDVLKQTFVSLINSSAVNPHCGNTRTVSGDPTER